MGRSRYRAFTLVDLTVVVFSVALVLALIVCALPRVTSCGESARLSQCKNNLKQLGVALHAYHDVWKCFPPGLVDDDDDPTEALHTGLLLLLPFLEETALYNAYNFKAALPPGVANEYTPNNDGVRGASRRGWGHPANSTVVSKQLSQFYCPTNRSEGVVTLGPGGRTVGATDYGLASGAIPLLCSNRLARSDAAKLRGMFGPNSYVRIKDITDGTGLTIAMGEISGGSGTLGTANVATNVPHSRKESLDKTGPEPWGIDQGWAIARIDGTRPEWPRGSILVSAFQHFGRDVVPRTADDLSARMNPTLVMISQTGNRPGDLPCGSLDDRLSPVRSSHEGGSHFLMGNGAVRFISDDVDLTVYLRLFTISGGEKLTKRDF